PSNLSTLLGQTYTSGQLIDQGSDVSPYFAIAGKVLRNGVSINQYVVIYKVQLMKPKSDWKTKGATINFVEVALDGASASLTSNGYYMNTQRSDDTNGSSTPITNWFTTPQFPTTDNTALTVVATKTDANTTISWTFSKASAASFSMRPADMVAANFPVYVLTALKAGTYTFPSVAGTTQVVKFTPTVAFAGGDKATVPINETANPDVHDNSNIACTAYVTQLTF